MANGEKRITLLVQDDLYERLNELVPHGFRKHLLIGLIHTALDAIENNGGMMVGALIAREFKLVRTDK